jgi:copper chaperone CopZ
MQQMESSMTHFTIPDMDCQGCVGAITRAIKAQDAGATVQANLETHLVEVTSTLSSDTIAAAIDAAGFTVQKS